MKIPDFIPKNKTIEKRTFFEFSPWQRPHRLCQKNPPPAQPNTTAGIHRKVPNIYRSLEQRNYPAWILVYDQL
jgi:hypothetical protein